MGQKILGLKKMEIKREKGGKQKHAKTRRQQNERNQMKSGLWLLSVDRGTQKSLSGTKSMNKCKLKI